MTNKITSLFNIKHPIVQGGMIWNSGWELASAVSNAGGLGIIGSGSMYPDILVEHIKKCQAATQKPFAVNVPLMYPSIEEHMENIMKLGVKIVFTSAGSPKAWTSTLQKEGIKVVHVVSSVKFAMKSEEAGVDAIVAEGFEAGGHNGREETTTLCLIPDVAQHIQIPLLAAGGIATGQQMLAAMILGADGVQVGSRFAATHEASSHPSFKDEIVKANEGDTHLTLKELAPVRLIRNEFWNQVQQAYAKGASKEDLQTLLGRGRAKKGMFEGDLIEGELEIGQGSSLIKDIISAEEVVQKMMSEFEEAKNRLQSL